MKKLLHKFINKAGYQLSRYTSMDGDEFPPTASFWQDYYYQAPDEFTDIYKKNRRTLKQVDDWMPAKLYNHSLFRYGIPTPFLGPGNCAKERSINYMPREFTYSDLITYFGKSLDPLKYLEIGVSAGKNFYQVMHSFNHSVLHGLDIEVINPVIEQKLSKKEVLWSSEKTYEFEKYPSGVVDIHYTVNSYDFSPSGNKIYYLKGDKFNPDLWERLRGNKFNLIFSDAFHKPESIRSEFNFLCELNLFDPDQLIMIWDDMDEPEMQIEFKKICLELEKMYEGSCQFALYDLLGSYGGDEKGIHKIGIFQSNRVLHNE